MLWQLVIELSFLRSDFLLLILALIEDGILFLEILTQFSFPTRGTYLSISVIKIFSSKFQYSYEAQTIFWARQFCIKLTLYFTFLHQKYKYSLAFPEF